MKRYNTPHRSRVEAESQRSAEAIRGQNQEAEKGRNRSQENRHSCRGHRKGCVRSRIAVARTRAKERSTDRMRRIIDNRHSPEKKRPHIGHYGHLRKAYLEGYRPDLYTGLSLVNSSMSIAQRLKPPPEAVLTLSFLNLPQTRVRQKLSKPKTL